VLYESCRSLGRLRRSRTEWQDDYPSFSLEDLWLPGRDPLNCTPFEVNNFRTRLADRIEQLTEGFKAEGKSPMLYLSSYPAWLNPEFRRSIEVQGWYVGCHGVVFNLYRRPETVLTHKRRELFIYLCRTLASDAREGYTKFSAQRAEILLNEKPRLCRLLRLTFGYAQKYTSLAFSPETLELEYVFRSFEPFIEVADMMWARLRAKDPSSSFYEAGEILDDII
jgi:hypothetical protein